MYSGNIPYNESFPTIFSAFSKGMRYNARFVCCWVVRLPNFVVPPVAQWSKLETWGFFCIRFMSLKTRTKAIKIYVIISAFLFKMNSMWGKFAHIAHLWQPFPLFLLYSFFACLLIKNIMLSLPHTIMVTCSNKRSFFGDG